MRLPQLAPLILMVQACTALGQGLATGVNYNDTTPAAPTGSLNIHWAQDSARPTVNASAYVTYPTVLVHCPASGDLSAPINTALALLPQPQGGIIDARQCQSATTWTTALTQPFSNTLFLLPCATLAQSATITVGATYRNNVFRGCAYQGGSASSGTLGGTVFNYTGSSVAFQIGDLTSTTDTPGFELTDLEINLSTAGNSADALQMYRVQQANIERLYLIGNGNHDQTAINLNGLGNYTGGNFTNIKIANFYIALFMYGDSTGAANASTFSNLHIDCPTNSGTPYSSTEGIDLVYGDGNTFLGGDVEGCAYMLNLGAGATNNTFSGLRNENSTNQVYANSGSSYNLWLTGGTMFTGKLTDLGTHNSFQDAFHRGFNQLNGDIWRSQADTTVTNHIYTGVGLGNVRGLQDEYQTDVPGIPASYQNAWLWGPGDGTTGLQLWQLQDLLNNVTRIGIQQYTTAGGSNQSFLNGAGTGNVCFNCSTNSGTGGTAFGSGGASPTTVGTLDNAGNLTLFGYLRWYASGAEQWAMNCASTTACNLDDWSTGSAVHRMRTYSGAGTDIDAAGTGAVTVDNTTGSGTGGFAVYGGGSTYYSTKLFQVQNNNNGTANYLLPSIAAGSGHNCIQVDASGYLTNTGAACFTDTNTIGCLDGFDHLPCTVYEMGLTSQSAVTGTYATAYTTTATGFYRITGNVYATTAGTGAYTVALAMKEPQVSSVTSHGLNIASAAVGTGEGWNNGTLLMQNLASSTAIQWETTGTGTNIGSVWNIDLTVERVK